ncbi:MAG: S24 family peptidase [Arcobacteraceae bacterium]|jgi:phage repressor protein C with HTH and peptisase S24 domain|nr:S24 family peptidase [Arcobacteraceae bacterium]
MNRLKEVRHFLGLTQQELADKINDKIHKINDIERGKQKISVDIAEIIQDIFPNISAWWLLTGKGKMLQTEQKEDTQSISTNNSSYKIDLLNVRAGAGEGIYNYVIETVDTISLDKSFFRTPINTSKVKGIQVDGDSMEPTLNRGDYILIDENITFGTDGIYAIQFGGQILIKRLQFKMDGTVLIISDNQKYQSETFNPSESQLPFQVLGIKVLSIQR